MLLQNAIADALNQVEGAYSLLLLTPDEIFAIRDPRGFRPLSIGRLNGAWVAASETCAFDLIGATYEREVTAALALWADHVRAIVEGVERKLVPLRKPA